MLRNFRFYLACLLITIGLTACGGDGTPAAPSPSPVVQTSNPIVVVVPTDKPRPVEASPTPTSAPTTRPTLALPTPGPAVVGALPAPFEARRLNLTVAMLQRVQKRLGGRFASADLTTLGVAAYANAAAPADVFDYYRGAMTGKGWTETHQYDNRLGIYFVQGGQVAAVNATGLPDDNTVNFLAGFVPDLKGQVKGGETLILLAQGPSATFEILRATP